MRVKKAIMQDYEASRVQTFISEFKNRELEKLEKESNKKIKKLEDKIKKLKLELTSQTTQ